MAHATMWELKAARFQVAELERQLAKANANIERLRKILVRTTAELECIHMVACDDEVVKAGKRHLIASSDGTALIAEALAVLAALTMPPASKDCRQCVKLDNTCAGDDCTGVLLPPVEQPRTTKEADDAG